MHVFVRIECLKVLRVLIMVLYRNFDWRGGGGWLVCVVGRGGGGGGGGGGEVVDQKGRQFDTTPCNI